MGFGYEPSEIGCGSRETADKLFNRKRKVKIELPRDLADHLLQAVKTFGGIYALSDTDREILIDAIREAL